MLPFTKNTSCPVYPENSGHTGRLLALLRLAYPSNIFFRCTTTNKGRRELRWGIPGQSMTEQGEDDGELCSGQSSDGKKATVSTCM
jgi:hypothetical protein